MPKRRAMLLEISRVCETNRICCSIYSKIRINNIGGAAEAASENYSSFPFLLFPLFLSALLPRRLWFVSVGE